MREYLAGIRVRLSEFDNALSGKIYLFGSCLRYDRFANDIDFLVIYKTDDELMELKAILHPLLKEYPLDLLFASDDEEKELQLMQVTNAEVFV